MSEIEMAALDWTLKLGFRNNTRQRRNNISSLALGRRGRLGNNIFDEMVDKNTKLDIKVDFIVQLTRCVRSETEPAINARKT